MKHSLPLAALLAFSLFQPACTTGDGQGQAIPPVGAAPRPAIGDGRIEVRLHPENGTYDVLEKGSGRVILAGARIGFTVAPYVELADVGAKDVETSRRSVAYGSGDCACRVGPDGAFICRKDGVGELEVRFQASPGQPYLDIGFTYRNLGASPVRLRGVTVVDGAFLPGLDRKHLQLLGGGSGDAATAVRKTGKLAAENNALCFFADPAAPRSLVAGGLTYEDFRKYVQVADGRIRLSAHDPVGKRVDGGQAYASPDRFYLDGTTANPFDALESYARVSQAARKIDLNYYTFPSVCMWFLSVSHMSGDSGSTNSSAGAVAEMKRIADTGFLRYSPVAVRLVPDCYEQDNQQGWWDDAHWQRHGRDSRCVVAHHYCAPYETTRKWAQAVRALGGIPLTYFQPGIRSEDYAAAFPEHMLYDQARKLVLVGGKPAGDPNPLIGTKGMADDTHPKKWRPGYGKLYAEAYDYTDPGFLQHLAEVYANLRDGGVQGLFYDYPDRAFPERGGLEDRYATATHAYRNVFRAAREALGPGAYLQERMGPGSDATLGLVSSVRTTGDNNFLSPAEAGKVAVRWYKNRRLTNYDMDGKALLESGVGAKRKLSDTERQAVLTMAYTVSGRLLLTESFRLFPKEVLHDLGRAIPFHATTLSARPLDAFVAAQPSVFDFPVSDTWHQLVMYNATAADKAFAVPLSGDTAFGRLGLDAAGAYYAYDFWNDRFAGKIAGGDALRQTLRPGEARMLAIHKAEAHPQFIATDRHLLQGYCELSGVSWDEASKTLSGKAKLVAGEPMRIVLARNGGKGGRPKADGAEAALAAHPGSDDLCVLILARPEGGEVAWSVTFE